MRRRSVLLAGVVIALVASACGNSKSSEHSTTTAPPSNVTATTANQAQLATFLPSHEPGVDDAKREIRVAAIVSKTNPTGVDYAAYTDGVQAYLDMVNAAGGIYGRKLVVVNRRDDIVGLQDTQQVKASLEDDHAFATFLATTGFGGADLLAAAHQPTYIWNINPEFASTPAVDHSTIFGTSGALCFTCPGQVLPWLVTKLGFAKVAVLAYGVAAQSKTCAAGQRHSYEQFAKGAKVVFFDDSLPFAADLAADVAQMKAKGVQFVSSCFDTNEVTKLGREMQKQGLHALQNLPNAYDHTALDDTSTARALEGDFVEPLATPWEAQPQSVATKEYLAHVTAVTKHPKELTEYGWVAARMFVDGLKGAGPAFTRQKVVDWLNSQRAYTAGGLIPAIDWTKQHGDPQRDPSARVPRTCVTVVQIHNGAFVPMYGAAGKPWICFSNSPDAALPVDPEHVSFSPDGVG